MKRRLRIYAARPFSHDQQPEALFARGAGTPRLRVRRTTSLEILVYTPHQRRLRIQHRAHDGQFGGVGVGDPPHGLWQLWRQVTRPAVSPDDGVWCLESTNLHHRSECTIPRCVSRCTPQDSRAQKFRMDTTLEQTSARSNIAEAVPRYDRSIVGEADPLRAKEAEYAPVAVCRAGGRRGIRRGNFRRCPKRPQRKSRYGQDQ